MLTSDFMLTAVHFTLTLALAEHHWLFIGKEWIVRKIFSEQREAYGKSLSTVYIIPHAL